MKKKSVLVTLFFIFLFGSANLVSAVHPLIGTWRCRYKIGSTYYIDYITITSVSSSGSVVGKDQDDYAVSGYTKNNMVFLDEKATYIYQDAYFWGYNGVVFAKHHGMFSYIYTFTATWHAMNQPTKVAAIPSDLPDRDSIEWSKSQSALIEMWQETQK